MTSIAVEAVAMGFVLLCLYRAEPARPFSSALHEDFLTPASGKALRGVLSMVVLLHHLSPKVGGILLFPVFSKLGYLTVSVFFFLSGYGLMKQYMGRPGYSRHFLLRRLPAVLFPYLLATALYWLLNRILGISLSLQNVINELRAGTPIVSASWYIICITLFYIGFRVLMLLCGKHYGWMLPGSLVWCGLYIRFCLRSGYSSWWYNTAPVLSLGIAWALREEAISRFFRKHYSKAAPAIFLIFSCVYGLKLYLNSRVWTDLVHIPLTWLAASLFTVCVLLVLMKLRLGNPLLQRLGGISLELYLCHYLFITLLRSELIFLANDFLYVCAVIFCSVAFAWVYHQINAAILSRYNKLLKKLP